MVAYLWVVLFRTMSTILKKKKARKLFKGVSTLLYYSLPQEHQVFKFGQKHIDFDNIINNVPELSQYQPKITIIKTFIVFKKESEFPFVN